jgi:hypothetical protein
MEGNKGKIDLELAKILIADHYDVYLKKSDNPCSRTVCSHYDLDGREYMSQADRPLPYQPRGAMDGFVVDSEMAKNMKICGRWGSSCGIPFDADNFFDEHRQWITQKPYISSRPTQPWTEFKIMDVGKNNKTTDKERKSKSKTKTKVRKTKTKTKNKTIKKSRDKKLVLEEDEEENDT